MIRITDQRKTLKAGVSKTLGTNYQAEADGVVIVNHTASLGTDTQGKTVTYSDATATPTAEVASTAVGRTSTFLGYKEKDSSCFFVKKGNYYRVDQTSDGTVTETWYPFTY